MAGTTSQSRTHSQLLVERASRSQRVRPRHLFLVQITLVVRKSLSMGKYSKQAKFTVVAVAYIFISFHRYIWQAKFFASSTPSNDPNGEWTASECSIRYRQLVG